MRPEQHHEDCDYRNSHAAVECDERHGVPDGEVANELHECNLGCEPAAHTPGPWMVGNDGQGIYVHPIGREGFTVAQPSGLDPSVTHVGAHTAEANARLIAAAPDLLEALQGIVRMWNAYGVGSVPMREVYGVHAAIAKATGQE